MRPGGRGRPARPVVVLARSDGSAERADRKVRALCEKVGAHVNGNVNVTCDSAALAEASFVVEAIVEDPLAKAGLMSELGPQPARGRDPRHDDVVALDRASWRRPRAGPTASSACTSSTPCPRWT